MKIDTALTDDSILAELGQRLAQHRVDLELTQAALARQAGISKRTVERMEAGATVQLSSWIRSLRGLGLLNDLERLIPETGPRPMELLRQKSRTRQRASSKRKKAAAGKTWAWGEDA